MNSIFKYPAPDAEDLFIIEMPKGAEIVCVEKQHGSLTLWAMVDIAEMETESRRFKIVGTGWQFEQGWEHVKTFFERPFVWHLMEKVE